MIVCAVIGIIANIAIPGLYAALYRAKAARIIEDYNTRPHRRSTSTTRTTASTRPSMAPESSRRSSTSYLQGRLSGRTRTTSTIGSFGSTARETRPSPRTGVIVGFSIVDVRSGARRRAAQDVQGHRSSTRSRITRPSSSSRTAADVASSSRPEKWRIRTVVHPGPAGRRHARDRFALLTITAAVACSNGRSIDPPAAAGELAPRLARFGDRRRR